MPRVSEFLGIKIGMFYQEHAPPHFHAVYAEYEAIIGIDPIVVLRGQLPRRAQSLVFEWAAMHQQELRRNWERAGGHEPLSAIAPLE